MMLRDNGVLRKMEYDVMNPELMKPDPKVRYNTPISIYEMGTAFMVEAVGILAGIVCFLVELCKGRGRKRALSKSPNSSIHSKGDRDGRQAVEREARMHSPQILIM